MPQPRMKSAERRNHLLKIMYDLHSRARTQADFTAQMVAEIEGISSVLVYRLAGKEFKELRGQLPGPRRSSSSVNVELRRENKKLQERVRQLEAERASDIQTAVAGANEIFERLDEDNRRWRSRCELLERRLNEKEFVVVELPDRDEDQEKKDTSSGKSGKKKGGRPR